ncbi:MAG: hypothetical protein J7498_03135 [Sphingobium sp.]|nr:hypothetical protein [Sphingobium sp.]
MTDEALADRALNVAQRLGRLSPDWQNPERYFERRDELRREMLALARQIGARHG